MDIAAVSTAMSQMNLTSQIGTAVLSMSMDMAESAGDGLVKVLESSVTSELGANIDIRI